MQFKIYLLSLLSFNMFGMELENLSLKDRDSYLQLLPAELHKELAKFGAYPELNFFLLKSCLEKRPTFFEGFKTRSNIIHISYDQDAHQLLAVSESNSLCIPKENIQKLQDAVDICIPDQLRIVRFPHLLKVWDLNDNSCVYQNTSYENPYYDSVLSSVHRLIITSDYGAPALHVADMKKGKQRTLPVKTNSHGIFNFQFDATNKYIFLRRGVNDLECWQLSNSNDSLKLKGKKEEVSCYTYDQNKSRVFLAGYKGYIKEWNLKTDSIKSFGLQPGNPINSIKFDAITNRLLTESSAKVIRIWNLDTYECSHILPRKDYYFELAEWDPVRNLIFNKCSHEINVWNIETGEQITTLKSSKTFLGGRHPQEGIFIFDREKNWFICQTFDKKFTIYDLTNFTLLAAVGDATANRFQSVYDGNRGKIISIRDNFIETIELSNTKLENELCAPNAYNKRLLLRKIYQEAPKGSVTVSDQFFIHAYKQLSLPLQTLLNSYITITKKRKVA